MKTLILVTMLLMAKQQAAPSNQYVVAVWGRECLESVEFTKNSTMEAPVDSNGLPIYKAAHLTQAHVSYNKNCSYRLEVRSR